MSDERATLLRDRLSALNPTQLEIINESHLHVGHAGSKDGASHFRLIISCEQFSGLSVLARHRLVYHHVHDLMPFPIHALAIVAQAGTSEGTL
ncbi:BolA family transcriptional regulator [Alcaligenaceae bacterium]|nr:BolA family transcriptional regulator [Alcaligenaceae bacterium]